MLTDQEKKQLIQLNERGETIPIEDDWSNSFIFRDNLLPLKAIYKDRRGENKLQTKNGINLIYIAPSFTSKMAL